ncbi:phospho-sugar mutase [Enteractinococcus fodinae]|uniref:Phosphomannomutase n=1 Tax=Enteractinococcus fodinae TaxID=684663 RepID=A0ABU2B3B8_9MICC|nr:phospho-sugar mutase [Enteractinococcus fodinae]MDR7347509.1 phosphomannomutase [Enteractinococcus fodinae]
MQSELEDVMALAREWMELDPANAGVLEAEIAAAERGDDTAHAALTARFAGYLTFGTAGLRAPLGPGTTRMNRVVVQRAAAGIADFATAHVPDPAVIIGYDARHGSKDFALDSAAVFTAAGCRVQLMAMPTPTPVVAFALQRSQADVGIMVTASHNPPTDNGYKVYLGARLADAAGAYAQITAPLDQQIATHIQRWNVAPDLPDRADTGWEMITEAVIDEYVKAVAAFLNDLSPTETHRRHLSVVYTPLHGVGAATFCELMEATGFSAPTVVTDQVQPDPTFPTVDFPNPEEPGALDLAVATAQTHPDTDLVIAHDPDADRLAIMVPIDGQWQRLTGDQIGLIIGARLMPYLSAHDLTTANSVVSAPQLAQLAQHHDVEHAITPTGFKWICRVPNLGYGYEEALGYAVAPQIVNDKDGLSAAVVVADLAAELKAKGSSLVDYLSELTENIGPALSKQISVMVPSPSVGTLLVEDLRTNPPETLAGYGPVTTIDYQQDDVLLAQRYGPQHMVEFATTGDISTRLMIRPSGTEPKVKCYISVLAEPGIPLATVEAVMHQLHTEAATLVEVT